MWRLFLLFGLKKCEFMKFFCDTGILAPQGLQRSGAEFLPGPGIRDQWLGARLYSHFPRPVLKAHRMVKGASSQTEAVTLNCTQLILFMFN